MSGGGSAASTHARFAYGISMDNRRREVSALCLLGNYSEESKFFSERNLTFSIGVCILNTKSNILQGRVKVPTGGM